MNFKPQYNGQHNYNIYLIFKLQVNTAKQIFQVRTTQRHFDISRNKRATASIIYNFGGDRYGKMKSQIAQRKIVENRLNNEISHFYSNMANAYLGTVASARSIGKFDQTVLSAEMSLKASKASFDVGAATILDILDSLQDLMDAQASAANARYNYLSSYISVRQLAGEDIREYTEDLDKVLTKQIKIDYSLLCFSSLNHTARRSFLSYFFNFSLPSLFL